VVEGQLFGEREFRIPAYGRSNVPIDSILEHPGVWENPKHGYLHEVLIKKEGIAATLAIVFTQVPFIPTPETYIANLFWVGG
jgi:hypothetical protein